MLLPVPSPSLVLLIGVSGSGKTTFARRHFRPTQVLSSDAFRAMVSDDEQNLAATRAAFDVLHFVAQKRLQARRLTVIDATNVQAEARKPLVDLARRHRCPAVAIVLDLPQDVCVQRNRDRVDRTVPESAIQRQVTHLRQSLLRLKGEGYWSVHILSTVEAVAAVRLERRRVRSTSDTT